MPGTGDPLLDMTSRMIQDNAAKPGRKPGLSPKFSNRPKGGEEGLLHHITGFVVISDDSVSDIEHLLLVPPDQMRECLGITPPAAGDKTGVIVLDGPVLRLHWAMPPGKLFFPVMACEVENPVNLH